jgi:hypothetical protein
MDKHLQQCDAFFLSNGTRDSGYAELYQKCIEKMIKYELYCNAFFFNNQVASDGRNICLVVPILYGKDGKKFAVP